MAPIYITEEIPEEKANAIKTLGVSLREFSSIGQVAELDSKNWIVVPRKGEEPKGFKNPLDYKYAVDPARISYNSAVERAGKELELKLENTAKDSLDRKFVGNIQWEQAIRLNLLLGCKATNPLEHFTFLDLINKGAEGKIKVYDVSETQLNQEYLGKIRDDIIKVQSPQRGEFLDAEFKFENNKYYIHFNHKLKNGNFSYTKQLLDENTLLENKFPGIDWVYFLGNTTKQGLPKQNIKQGSIYYFAPNKYNNSVAKSSVDDDWAYFYCSESHFKIGLSLGVRAMKILKD